MGIVRFDLLDEHFFFLGGTQCKTVTYSPIEYQLFRNSITTVPMTSQADPELPIFKAFPHLLKIAAHFFPGWSAKDGGRAKLIVVNELIGIELRGIPDPALIP